MEATTEEELADGPSPRSPAASGRLGRAGRPLDLLRAAGAHLDLHAVRLGLGLHLADAHAERWDGR